LRGFATAEAPLLVEEVARIAQAAAFRHLIMPGGYTMSVAMTNCGRVGWVSDRTGYRYDSVNPDTGSTLARDAQGVPRHRCTCCCRERVRKLRSRRVADRPLCRGRQTQSPSGP
jgi:hypothetical protein